MLLARAAAGAPAMDDITEEELAIVSRLCKRGGQSVIHWQKASQLVVLSRLGKALQGELVNDAYR